MPNMAPIVVKKNDGTTDVTYTDVVPSAGDKTSAIWKCLTIGTASAHRPELKMSSRENGTGTARRVEMQFAYPVLATDAQGKLNVVDRLPINISVLVPKGMPDADVNEGVSQCFNLVNSALIKSAVKSGYAPT